MISSGGRGSPWTMRGDASGAPLGCDRQDAVWSGAAALGAAILLYELGFADRCLASHLLGVIGECGSGADALVAMSAMAPEVLEVLGQYPSYFMGVLEQL